MKLIFNIPLKYPFLFTFAISLLLASCGGQENRVQENNQFKSYNQDSLKTDNAAYELSYVLPSPVQIARIFKEAGLVFETNLICEEPVEKYKSTVAKELIFGVYSSDLSYCLINGQRQLALTRIDLLEAMSADMGLDKVLKDKVLLEEFRDKSQHLDSALSLLNNLQEQSDMLMYENNMQARGYMMFTGAWIEGMYLSSKASKLKDNALLVRKLVEQRTILATLLRALEDLNKQKNSAEITNIITRLNDLKSTMDDVNVLKRDDLTEELVVSSDELALISVKIQSLRSFIVNELQ